MLVYATEFIPSDATDEHLARAINGARLTLALIANGELYAATPELTLLEVLVGPIKRGMTELVELYKTQLVPGGSLDMLPVTRTVLEEAAKIRAAHNLKPPDAIHLASAITANCSILLCNDHLLSARGTASGEIEGMLLQDVE